VKNNVYFVLIPYKLHVQLIILYILFKVYITILPAAQTRKCRTTDVKV
jgi:hypothetical protein